MLQSFMCLPSSTVQSPFKTQLLDLAKLQQVKDQEQRPEKMPSNLRTLADGPFAHAEPSYLLSTKSPHVVLVDCSIASLQYETIRLGTLGWFFYLFKHHSCFPTPLEFRHLTTVNR
jgi:hypothetical protein